MDEQSIRQAITPLKLVFWGGLLCLFDFTFSTTSGGEGFKFDILNDAVGAVLIAVGVFKLSAISVHARYGRIMTFVKVISVLAVADAVRDHFVLDLSPAAALVLHLFSLAGLAAIVAFCVAMRWFSQEAALNRAVQSWRVTTWLFVIIYAIPLGILQVVHCGALLAGESFFINLGPAVLLLLPVFFAPIVHLFISTSRMKREAENLSAMAEAAELEGGM